MTGGACSSTRTMRGIYSFGGEDNIKMDLQETRRRVWNGWSWLRIGTGGVHL